MKMMNDIEFTLYNIYKPNSKESRYYGICVSDSKDRFFNEMGYRNSDDYTETYPGKFEDDCESTALVKPHLDFDRSKNINISSLGYTMWLLIPNMIDRHFINPKSIGELFIVPTVAEVKSCTELNVRMIPYKCMYFCSDWKE